MQCSIQDYHEHNQIEQMDFLIELLSFVNKSTFHVSDKNIRLSNSFSLTISLFSI